MLLNPAGDGRTAWGGAAAGLGCLLSGNVCSPQKRNNTIKASYMCIPLPYLRSHGQPTPAPSPPRLTHVIALRHCSFFGTLLIG